MGSNESSAAFAYLQRHPKGAEKRDATNVLLACALYDVAFEQGWLTLADDQRVLVSTTLLATADLEEHLKQAAGRVVSRTLNPAAISSTGITISSTSANRQRSFGPVLESESCVTSRWLLTFSTNRCSLHDSPLRVESVGSAGSYGAIRRVRTPGFSLAAARGSASAHFRDCLTFFLAEQIRFSWSGSLTR